MGRLIKHWQVNVPPQSVFESIRQFLTSEGYEYKTIEGENVFQNGTGIAADPSFFKISFNENTVRIEVWWKQVSTIPTVADDEFGSNGLRGKLNNRMVCIEQMLSQCGVEVPVPNGVWVSDTVNDTVAQPSQVQGAFPQNPAYGQPQAPVQQNPAYGQPQAPVPQNIVFQQQPQQYMPAVDPRSVSKKEFIKTYASPYIRKNIRSCAIACYVCSGATFFLSLGITLMGVFSTDTTDSMVLIVDFVIKLFIVGLISGLALGMHKGGSSVCAILILVFGILDNISGLIVNQTPSGIFLTVAGVYAVITFNKVNKQYKTFQMTGVVS